MPIGLKTKVELPSPFVQCLAYLTQPFGNPTLHGQPGKKLLPSKYELAVSTITVIMAFQIHESLTKGGWATLFKSLGNFFRLHIYEVSSEVYKIWKRIPKVLRKLCLSLTYPKVILKC